MTPREDVLHYRDEDEPALKFSELAHGKKEMVSNHLTECKHSFTRIRRHLESGRASPVSVWSVSEIMSFI